MSPKVQQLAARGRSRFIYLDLD